MSRNEPSEFALSRVETLIALYATPQASAAALLCDNHDPGSVAYRIVRSDKTMQEVTYGQLRQESECFSAALASLGLKPGDRIATLMDTGRTYLVTLIAIWRLGAVHVPLFTAFGPKAIAERLLASDAMAVLCDPGQLPKLAPNEHIPTAPRWQVITTGAATSSALSYDDLMRQAQPGRKAAAMGGDAPFLHVFTSGTTGAPKGIVVPLRALASFQTYAEFGLDLRPDDVFWCAVDRSWSYWLYCGMLATCTTGTLGIMLQGELTPRTVMSVLAEQRVTNFSSTSAVYRSLCKIVPQDSTALHIRCASSAGEPLPLEVSERATKVLGVPIHDHYGQMEAGMLINNHHNPLTRRPNKPGLMGHAMPGWTATILDNDRDEELAVNQTGRVAMVLAQSPLAWFSGYEGEAEQPAEKFAGNGRWYVTGDSGLVDADGYFHFSARDEDIIFVSSYRVSSLEVETAMATHPAVAQCAVIGVPDEIRGEVIEAYVVLAEGAVPSPELARDIQAWVKPRHAAHAYPQGVHFAASIPRSSNGKVQRLALRQQWQQEQAAKLQAKSVRRRQRLP